VIEFKGMDLHRLRGLLENLYERFNDPKLIHPDPLEFVVRYPEDRDQEIVALIAACLAYGRVQAILKFVARVLAPMGDSPARFILSHTEKDFKSDELYGRFVYRFTRGDELSRLLSALRKILLSYGSLKECFLSYDRAEEPTFFFALSGFALSLRKAAGGPVDSLVPNPLKGSAMKRLNLFLRWMVRRDAVDPGTWQGLSPARLVVPLDTHLHAFGLHFGLTRRKNADRKTAMEITQAFRQLAPKDPIRYDFALAHMGILRLDEAAWKECLAELPKTMEN